MKLFLRSFCVTVGAALLANTSFAAIKLDANIPQYEKSGGFSGTLNSVGSDTLNNMMTLWFEKFAKLHPGVKIQIEGKGSSTAPPALIEGTSQLGPMSREMKRSEIEAYEAKYGFPPTKIAVALDALAVFVNKDNPIESLSLPQVDAIFSVTRKGKFSGGDILTWGQTGLSWEKNRPISLYGRNSASGTYGFFKKKALFKGDYKNTVKEQPGSASVVLGITEDTYGIGYSGLGFVTSGVKALAIAKKEGGKAYAANYENVLSSKYPLSRFLYIYFTNKPNQDVDPLIKEFFTFILSKEGQAVVVKDGYLPLPAKAVFQQRALLK